MLEEMQNYRDLDYINVIQCITSALAGAKMLKLLVNDILDMAQIKAGKFSLNYS
jgi:signal transduction histidine kinase